jgi:hypothetical protein
MHLLAWQAFAMEAVVLHPLSLKDLTENIPWLKEPIKNIYINFSYQFL